MSTNRHGLGRELKCFVRDEATYATYAAGTGTGGGLVSADAFKALTLGMEFTQTRNDRVDSRQTRSVQERITGRKEASWSCEMYALPGTYTETTPGVSYTLTAPDSHEIMIAGFGAQRFQAIFEVKTFGSLAGAIVTLTGDGDADSLTEGVDWTAATSNNATASSLATAINAIDRYNATADGAKVTVYSSSDTANETNISTATKISQIFAHDDAIANLEILTAADEEPAVQYVLGFDQLTTCSLEMTRHMPKVMSEVLQGCWVESSKLTLSGGNEPRWTFEGGASDQILTGTSTGADDEGGNGADAVAGDTGIRVAAADIEAFAVNSVIQLRDPVSADVSNGAGEGHRVTAINTTTNELTFAPAIDGGTGPFLTTAGTGTAATSCVIEPFTPTETTASSPLAGITGSLTLASGSGPTIGSTAIPITAFELEVVNNTIEVNDEALTSSNQDYIPGWRAVQGTISFRVRKDMVHILAARKDFTAFNLSCTVGSVVGQRYKIDIDKCELEITPIEIPEDAEATVSATIKGLGTNGEDEVTVSII